MVLNRSAAGALKALGVSLISEIYDFYKYFVVKGATNFSFNQGRVPQTKKRLRTTYIINMFLNLYTFKDLNGQTNILTNKHQQMNASHPSK